jgi:hypothetical protein
LKEKVVSFELVLDHLAAPATPIEIVEMINELDLMEASPKPVPIYLIDSWNSTFGSSRRPWRLIRPWGQ